MNIHAYEVVYDISSAPLPDGFWEWILIICLGFIIIPLYISQVNSKYGEESNYHVFTVALIMVWLGMSGLLGFELFSSYSQCVDWVKNGDYSVVTGDVTDFKPMPYAGHKQETFTVEDINFEYSDYEISGCGFHNTAIYGGPIKAGLPVRISYRGKRILILEIEK
jgi:hypothetical protein